MDQEKKYYDKAVQEIDSGNLDYGIWNRALTETSDEGARAKTRYIKLRIKALKAKDHYFEDVAQREHWEEPGMTMQQSRIWSQGEGKAITMIIVFVVILVGMAFAIPS